jgi:small GTP-binding protein
MGDSDYVYKIIFVGDSGVGKSSLVYRLTEPDVAPYDDISPENLITIGVDFKMKPIIIKPHKKELQIKTYIWDTAGQESFRSIIQAYYRLAVGGFVVFDISNRSSFLNAIYWIRQLQLHREGEIIIILIGNKCDLEERRVVQPEEACEIANDYGIQYFECSAQNGQGIDRAFNGLVLDIYQKYHDTKIPIRGITVNRNTRGECCSVM